MNKIILAAITGLMAFSTGQATQLSPRQALQRMQAAAPQHRVSSNTSTPVYTACEDGENLFYIFQTGIDSYLITAADDCAAPVLGYFDCSNFNYSSLPVNVKGWLEGCARQIKQGIEIGTAYAQSPQSRAGRLSVEPLVLSNWTQEQPFNDLCPTIKQKHTLVGCVATAMAQIMRLHKWPAQGKGSNSYLWKEGGQTLSMDFSQMTFDWDNMEYNYNSQSTKPQREAVAKLSYACGIATDMQYSLTASGTPSDEATYALYDYFDYDQWIATLPRAYFTDSQWDDKLYQEMIAGRPVLYYGAGGSGGHAFVCDGYNAEDGFYHFNWGWGGQLNGFFNFNALNTNMGDYNQSQGMVMHICKPQNDGKQYWNMVATKGLSGELKGAGVNLYPFSNPSDKLMAAFTNLTTPTFSGAVGVEMVNVQTGESINYSSVSSVKIPTWSLVSYLQVRKSRFQAGNTYRVYPTYQPAGEEKWQRMLVNSDVDTCVIVKCDSLGTISVFSPSQMAQEEKMQWKYLGKAKVNDGGISAFINKTYAGDDYEADAYESATYPGKYKLTGTFAGFASQLTKNDQNFSYYGNSDAMIIDATNASRVMLEDCSTGLWQDAYMNGVRVDGYMIDYTSQVYYEKQNGAMVTTALYGKMNNRTITFPAKTNSFTSIIVKEGDKVYAVNAAGTFAVTLPEESEINNIAADENNEITYYNLQGVKVTNPGKGIFIRRQNGVSEKVILN